MTLIDHVLQNVNFKDYYQKKFPQWSGDHNDNVSCPFSETHAQGTDSRPSFSVNINDKGGCVCHSCGVKIASIIHFEKKTAPRGAKLDDETAASRIFSTYVRSVMAAPSEVASHLFPWDNSLKGAPKVFGSLQKEIGISEKTCERFDLGWDTTQRRITIPIIDNFGQLLNVRFYRLPSMRTDDKYPKILNQDGFGKPATLFPSPQISSLCSGKHRPPVVYWMTGERDTLKAWDDGVPAFCYTTGENTCKKEWATEIENFHASVGIVADNDKAGKEGAAKRMAMLEAAGIPCFIVEFTGDNVKDYSDYRKERGTVKDFLEYDKSVPGMEPKDEDDDEKEQYYPIPKVHDPSKTKNQGDFPVSEIGRRPDLLNKPITVKAIVSGKMERTYSIPNIFQVGDHLYKLPVSREMVQLIREKDDAIVKLIHIWLNTKARVKIVGHITVTEVEIIPMIQPGVESPYVNQRCYFFGPSIECNKPYLMHVIPTTDMRTQETIGMIIDAEPVSNILDSYKFDEESCRLLHEEFHINNEMGVLESLQNLAHVVADNHTGIRNRDDLHLAGLLTWLSPLQFEFPFEGLQRGWLNTLVLGDTETGKSKVCQKLTSLFGCGVFINAESCSYVGLVGGAVKSSSGMFILRWGKIPLYNRQLVVVEELSGLTTQEISYMSDIRSAGVARYDKAGLTGETSAKTRLIFLSNVRGEGKSLADYSTGVQAAQGLIGQNEDVARFDLILTVTDDEVDGTIINKDRSKDGQKTFTDIELKAFKELVMFAWSLKPEQIEFTLSAYRACLQQTLLLSSKYHPSLPVFKAGSGRLKLARIAVSIACVQFAWDSTKGKLIVTDRHVEAAAELLHRLYRKPSFGYARYSHTQYSLQKVLHEPEVTARIKEVFKGKDMDFFSYVANAHGFSKFDIGEALGIHFMFVERVISQMFMSNLLKKGEQRGEWTLSRPGRKWVEKKISEKGL